MFVPVKPGLCVDARTIASSKIAHNGVSLRVREGRSARLDPLPTLQSGEVAQRRIRDEDYVVGMEVVKPGGTLLTVTERGFGKRTELSEYPRKGRPWSKEDIRERIVSDFRDLRFTWRGFFKWTGATILGVILGAMFALYFLDWNTMRGPIARWLSHRTGREIRIDGNLAVKLFTWQPSADPGGVFIGNPKWVGTPQAAKAKELRIEVRLVPLFWGHLVVPFVRIDSGVPESASARMIPGISR